MRTETDIGAPGEERVEDSLHRIVAEGTPRLHRDWPALLATGGVGGLDVATGVLALLAVEAATGSALLGGLAFSIGLIALLLGHSELFTEGFLVPVAVVAAGRARPWDMLRMWFGVLVANVIGGWVATWLIIEAFPDLRRTAVTTSAHFIDLGINLRSFCLAVLGGAVITLMTRMQHGTESMPSRIVAAVAAGFLLAGLRLDHSILDSLIIFTGLHSGHTSFGYLAWLGWFGWAILGNAIGGIGLVTLLRLIRTRRLLREHRAKVAPGGPRPENEQAPGTGPDTKPSTGADTKPGAGRRPAGAPHGQPTTASTAAATLSRATGSDQEPTR